APTPSKRAWGQDVLWPAVGSPGVLPLKAFPNARFKLIPSIVDGPYVLRLTVPPTPCLLGMRYVGCTFACVRV
ncbi:DUF1336 domain-containing protein, partial [archaeon]